MPVTFNDKLIAYLTLLSGLAISGVAEYYSIMGLIAIYPAAFWPIVIMGVVLGMGKITGTVWLKQNWEYAPWFLKTYILPAIIVLMMITSLGVFGFLSKAHSDQSLVSGDVQAKIAVYDEKIKVAKDNIDANRKALKQMDEAVDQVMGRSQDEKGADKAVAIRRGQAKERSRLLSEITAEQKVIAKLSEERAPIAAEVRKVEAEVGPIKYIAHLLYGENPDANILEKAVIWVTVLIVVVLDPLAVVLLLASQFSFQRFRKLEQEDNKPDVWVADVGEKPTAAELGEWTEDDFESLVQENFVEEKQPETITTATIETSTTSTSTISYQILEEVEEEVPLEVSHPYLFRIPDIRHPPGVDPVGPMVYKEDQDTPKELTLMEKIEKYGYSTEGNVVKLGNETYNLDEFEKLLEKEINPNTDDTYVQNEEQKQSGQWNRVISEQEYRQKVEQHIKNESNNNINNAA